MRRLETIYGFSLYYFTDISHIVAYNVLHKLCGSVKLSCLCQSNRTRTGARILVRILRIITHIRNDTGWSIIALSIIMIIKKQKRILCLIFCAIISIRLLSRNIKKKT